MKHRKHQYPNSDVDYYVRERTGNTCELCGVAHDAVGYRDVNGQFVTSPDFTVGLLFVRYVGDIGDRVTRIIIQPVERDGTWLALCQHCFAKVDVVQYVLREARKPAAVRYAQMGLFDETN